MMHNIQKRKEMPEKVCQVDFKVRNDKEDDTQKFAERTQRSTKDVLELKRHKDEMGIETEALMEKDLQLNKKTSDEAMEERTFFMIENLRLKKKVDDMELQQQVYAKHIETLRHQKEKLKTACKKKLEKEFKEYIEELYIQKRKIQKDYEESSAKLKKELDNAKEEHYQSIELIKTGHLRGKETLEKQIRSMTGEIKHMKYYAAALENELRKVTKEGGNLPSNALEENSKLKKHIQQVIKWGDELKWCEEGRSPFLAQISKQKRAIPTLRYNVDVCATHFSETCEISLMNFRTPKIVKRKMVVGCFGRDNPLFFFYTRVRLMLKSDVW